MSATITNIGSSSTVSAGTVTITIGAGGVPANTQIVVCACDNGIGGGASGSVADSKGNTYLSSTGFGGNTPFADIFRERTGIALVNGDTITYTLSSGATLAAVNAFYVQGLLAAAATANASAQGTSTTPSVTSGTIPTRCLVVGVVGGQTAVSSFTQDSTNAAWATPPGQISIVAPVLGGGNVVNTSTAALTYAPTLGTSDAWTALITAFRIMPEWDFQQTDQYSQPPRPVTKYSRSALRGKSSFAVFSQWVNMGWEVQSPQPPHPTPEKRAAGILHGDDGTQARFINWKNSGWEIQSPQSPHRAPEVKSGAIARGDDGTQAQFVNWQNYGWDIQPFLLSPRYLPTTRSVPNSGDDGIQNPFIAPSTIVKWWETQSQPLPRPNAWRGAAGARGDDGTQSNFINWQNSGWEIQSPQPPHPRPERASAGMRGDDGTQSGLINWINTGWETQPPQPPHPRPERYGAIVHGDDGTQATFVNWLNNGWDVLSPQPPHPRPEKFGATARGGDGIQSPFVPPSTLKDWGWEVQSVQPPHPTSERRAAATMHGDDSLPILINWKNFGWEVQAWQPPHPRPEKYGSTSLGDQGTQAPFVPPIVINGGFEPITPTLRTIKVTSIGALGGDSQYASFQLTPWWDDGVLQLRTLRQGGAALAKGDDGIENTFIVTPPSIKWWEIQPTQPPHPRSEKFGVLARGDDGNVNQFINWKNYGWEIQPPQPPRWRWERAAATMRGDDGTQFILVNWQNYGWEIQPPQPPHPHPEKYGALAKGDDGTENVFTFVVVPINWYETTPPSLPQPRQWRGGAWMRGDDGTQATFVNWFNYGWNVQDPQPPHPRSEKSGAIMRGDDGVENTFTFVAVPINWYETTPPSLPQPHQWRGGAFMRGDDGTEGIYVNWKNSGWEIQPWQPPHYAPEKKGASWLRGDDGTQAQYVNWKTFGWPVQPWQPPHPTPEKRAAAWMRGDDGNQAQFFNWKNAGWEIQAWQPPHAGVEEAGAIMFGDNGIVAPYIPPPPGVPLRLRTLMGFGL